MQHLLNQGFTGQGAIAGGINPAMAAAQGLLGGGDGGGLFPGMQYLLNQGLPGQQGVEEILRNQLGVFGGQQQQGLQALNRLQAGDTTQNMANQALQSVIQGQGMPTPEYVQAATERLLEPAQRDLMGQLNALGGGQGFLQSGLPQELMRQQRQDFLNDLILSGQGTFGQALGQGLQAGGQTFNQALQAAQAQAGAGQDIFGNVLSTYGAIPQAQLPVMQMAGGLQGQLADQALQQYTALGGQGLQAMQTASGVQQALSNQALQRATGMGGQELQRLQTVGQLGQVPFQQAQAQAQLRNAMIPEALGRERFAGEFGQQGLGQAMNYLQAMNQFNMGQQDINASILRTLLTGTAQTGGGGIIGSLVGKGIQALPGVAAAFSSQQFKHDVRPLGSTKDTLDIVKDLELVNFKYHWEDKDHVGIILEDSHPILTTEDGTKVDVDIIGVLIGAIQEQQKQIAELKELADG